MATSASTLIYSSIGGYDCIDIFNGIINWHMLGLYLANSSSVDLRIMLAKSINNFDSVIMVLTPAQIIA